MQVTEENQVAADARQVPARAAKRYWPWVLGICVFVAGLLGLDRTVYHRSLRGPDPARAASDQYYSLDNLVFHGPIAWVETAVRFPASIQGGLAVFFVMLIAHPARWRRIIAALLACLSAGLLGSLLKMTVARARPDHAGPEAYLVFHPFTGFAKDAAVSFPSGEATAAFALATVLALMYPRLTWPCYILAVMTCSARLISGSHYVSDVAAGAMLATLIVRWLLPRYEGQLNTRFPAPSDA